MRKNSLIKLIVCIVAIVGLFLAFVQPLANSIRQGLDLQGGTHVVLEAEDTDVAKVNDDAMNRVVTIMEKRVNALGLTEPIIQREGERRVIIELPGVKDPDAAIKTIGKTAMLEFKDEDGNTVLTGTDLKDAQAATNQQNGQNVVNLEFTDEGAKKFADLTTKNVGRTIAILLDGEVLTSASRFSAARLRSRARRRSKRHRTSPSSSAAARCRSRSTSSRRARSARRSARIPRTSRNSPLPSVSALSSCS